MKTVLMGVLLVLSGALALAADLPHPPHTVSRSSPGPHTTKASSFVPQGHSKNHVYGAPVSTPILHRRLPTKKKPSVTLASPAHPVK
jgi:hypothetical protein